jgi:hypothetical protein
LTSTAFIFTASSVTWKLTVAVWFAFTWTGFSHRYFDDREFPFGVCGASELGAFDEDVRVGHADPALIRDLTGDRAGLSKG